LGENRQAKKRGRRLKGTEEGKKSGRETRRDTLEEKRGSEKRSFTRRGGWGERREINKTICLPFSQKEGHLLGHRKKEEISLESFGKV